VIENSVKVAKYQSLEVLQAEAGILLDKWQQSVVTIKARKGGEKIRLPNREGHHALKDLFQEAGIPPWERQSIPLVYLNDELAAVGDLWISADFYQMNTDSTCVRLIHKK